MADQIISQEYLREIFDYKDGELYNKTFRNPNSKIGSKAGKVGTRNYKRIMVNSVLYQFHHIVYFYHHGIMPKVVDHIDGNPANNKIENLRMATFSQNSYNAKLSKKNKSGHKNICWCKKYNYWFWIYGGSPYWFCCESTYALSWMS